MGREPKGGDKWAAARRSPQKTTTPEQVARLFEAYRTNGGNAYQAAKAAGLRDATGRYYIKKAADPKYALKKEIPSDVSQASWIKQSAFDMKLNNLIELVFSEIETKLETASLSETVKAQRELLSLRRFILTPPTRQEKADKQKDITTPPSTEDDIAAILRRAEQRKRTAKSLPLGDTTPDAAPSPEAPVEEASAEM